MTAITIKREVGRTGEPRFRARAGEMESIGATPGEALDALTEGWRDEIRGAAVVLEAFQPDEYFTEEQHSRMHYLLARRDSLAADERRELESLIHAELDATISRTDSLASLLQP